MSLFSQKLSREDFKKKKELEEQRKLGNAPAEVDEEGKDINPHIPEYMSKAPWYLNQSGPTLKHQRASNVKEYDTSFDNWYKKGVKKEAAVTFRKGACANCGAMTHKTKDCVERPRKVGAKYTKKNIMPDEYVSSVNEMNFDAKRDRWNGYDPSRHQAIIRKYTLIDEERKKEKLRAMEGGEEKEEEEKEGEGAATDQSGAAAKQKGVEGDGDFAGTNANAFSTTMDRNTKTTVRNLRIREDTAKYLYNLDPNSAFYDPKSRAMRGNPLPHKAKEDLVYGGDNFVRFTGDTQAFNTATLHQFEAFEKGQDIHMQALPTQAEKLHSMFEDKKAKLETERIDHVKEKYGDAAQNDLDPELLFSQTEVYQEYNRHGRPVTVGEVAVPSSKYEEDVYPGNHTSVYGSYWENGQWGYACCGQCEKKSYCTGRAGWEAKRSRESLEEAGQRILEQREQLKAKKKTAEDTAKEEREKKERFEQALRDEDERNKRIREGRLDDRKGYNSLSANNNDVTEEEMEAYRLKRLHADDPMRNMAAGEDSF